MLLPPKLRLGSAISCHQTIRVVFSDPGLTSILPITIIMIPPDEELAEPVLALSKEEADEVADDT